MPNVLISTALAGGLMLSLFGFVLFVCDVRRPRAASALLAAGLFMWAAGLYAATPFVRIIAFGLFAMFTLLAGPLTLAVASKPKQRRIAAAYLFLMFVPATTVPMLIVRSNVHHLLVAQQSPALALASVWLAAASVILIAVVLAVALALSPGRARRPAS
jgi:hypothetical protein